MDQLQEDLSEFYHKIEREWKKSQEDAVLSFNELAAVVGLLGDGVFTDDYQLLAGLNLEVSGESER